MKLTVLVTYILLSYFESDLVGGVSRFYNPWLCNTTSNVSCSQQLSGEEDVGACTIYPNLICKHYELPGRRVFYLESQTSFTFMLFVYKYNDGDLKIINLGLNISLKTSNPEISAFLFNISQIRNDYQSCRLFDFSQAKRNFNSESGSGISLYYDCYKGMEQESLLYDVIVNAIPTNEEIRYKVLLPSLRINEKADDPCIWSPLKMINVEALKRNIVELKFTTSPRPITSYLIRLSSSDGLTSNLTSYVPYQRHSEWHKVIFEPVPNGKYTVSIVPVLLANSTNECEPNDYLDILVFYEGNFNHQLVFVIIICGSLACVVLLGFVMHKLCHRIGPQDSAMLEMPKPKVLILYSFDCTQHLDVVLKFAEYLKSFCNMEVMLDELDMGVQSSVAIWLSESITASQFVVVVISRGVHHKAEGKNKPPMNEESPYGDRFLPALNLLMNKVASSKIDNENNHNAQLGNVTSGAPPFQVIKVRFEYSSWRHVPSALFKIGPNFFLMNQLNEFLCQIHCQQSKVFPIKIFPKMPGSDFMTNSKGKELLKAIDDMIVFQKKNTLWFKKACEPAHGSIENDESSNTTSEQMKLTKCEEDAKMMTQLNVTDNSRKPSPSNSGKSVKISLDEEKMPETEELLEREIGDEKV